MSTVRRTTPTPPAGGKVNAGSRHGSSASIDTSNGAPIERVRVTVRVRPPTEDEIAAHGGKTVVDTDVENGKLTVLRRGGVVEVNEYTMDAVLPPSCTQGDVYLHAAKPVVEDVLQGYNGTVMAYGQTGAGKTYTLSSVNAASVGIIPRATAEVFVAAQMDEEYDYRMFMSYIQIYMEMIQDLIRPENQNMQIREGDNGVYIEGVEEVEVSGVEDCLKLIQLGERNRVFAFTKLNAHSSRSHAIVMLSVEKRLKKEFSHRQTASQRNKVIIGKLFLVDLAGSERLKKSGSQGQRASEAKSINLSLTVLGKCINARAMGESHIPFRDSKLTRLLQESLGGNAKTSLIINIAPCPEHADETINSLMFGQRAMKVKTRAIVNEEVDYRQLSENLQNELDTHDERLHTMEAIVLTKEEELAVAYAKVQLFEEEKKRLEAQAEAERREMQEAARALETQWVDRVKETEKEYREKVADTEQSKQQVEAQLRQTKEELDDVYSQRDGLTETLGLTKSKVTKLEKKLAEMEAKYAETVQRSEMSGRQAEALFLRKAEADRRNNAARVIQRAVRVRQFAALQGELSNTLAEGKARAERDAARIRQLEQQLEASQAREKGLESNVSDLQADVARLKKEVAALNESVADAGTQIMASSMMLVTNAAQSFHGLSVKKRGMRSK
eukprot:jgi/Mesvir1/23215/Mv22674-RA.2